MDLKEIIKDFSYDVNTFPIAKNLNNNLPENEYENLYQYFMDERERYYHTLVNGDGEQILKEEFCLLLNYDKEENDVENRSDYVKFYEFDYEIKGNVLTIYVCFTDYFTQSEVRTPFTYDLKDTKILYELNEFLKQDKADLFFIKLINNNLTVEHNMECSISNEFKINLESVINKFLDDRPVVCIDDVLDEVEDYECKGQMEYQKYNWTDVKGFAEDIFYNYEFEIVWAEDAWNTLMFNSVVVSTNIIGSDHSDYQKGDIVLWLAALYDLYYEYKVAADYESYDGPTPMENIDRINNVEKYISVFLKGDIFEKLNAQLSEGKCNQSEFYNIGMDTFLFTDYYDEPSIAYQVYCNEIKKRREIIENIFYSYYKGNTILISEFMEGTHWCENYLNNDSKRKRIVDKYETILKHIEKGRIVRYTVGNSEFEYTEEDEVNDDMENELEELDNEIMKYKSDAQTGRVYGWISNGMAL